MSAPRRAANGDQAQSLIEFALVMPLFLLLLFALIDFGRLEFSYVSLANAAREMARTATIATNSSNVVVDSFNNFSGMILSPPLAGDNVLVTVRDRTCAGAGPCTGVDAPVSFSCPLPLAHATCTVPPRTGLSGGSIDIVATSQYTFSPLFQNRLTGIVDASFMQQFGTMSTTARAYIE